MDNTMSNWSNILKSESLIKNDDFVEDYGFINDADIANWFQSLEQTFEQMLLRVGIEPNPESIDELVDMLNTDDNFRPKVEKRLSYNQKRIRSIGIDIGATLLQECMEKFMTEYSKTMEDDTERSISTMLGSQAYNDTLEALLDFCEILLSTIFDSVWLTVRYQLDDPERWDNDNVDDAPIDVDAPIDKDIMEKITKALQGVLSSEIPSAVNTVVNKINSNLTGDKQVLGEVVSDKLQEIIDDDKTQKMLEEFSAYVYQSFWLKWPLQQIMMARNEKVSDPDIEEPTIRYGEEYEQKDKEGKTPRKRFEDEYKSNDQYTNEHSWQSILSKNTGIGMTSNAGFTPAIHNVSYSKEEPCCDECSEPKPPCSRCKDKTTPCGCDN